MKLSRLAPLVASLALAASAQAALVSTTLQNVMLAGTAYDVTFIQDNSGATSFNDVFGAGSSPVLTFNNPINALTAANELRAAVEAASFNVAPGSNSEDDFGFILFYGYSTTTFDYFAGWPDLANNQNVGVSAPLSASRSASSVLSFVTLQATRENAIPEPGSLALVGLALAGLGLARRRRA